MAGIKDSKNFSNPLNLFLVKQTNINNRKNNKIKNNHINTMEHQSGEIRVVSAQLLAQLQAAGFQVLRYINFYIILFFTLFIIRSKHILLLYIFN